MRLRPIKPKPPGYRTALLVLVPVIAGTLALSSLFVACDGDENDRSSQQDYRKFSPRPDTGTESIQLSPCQQSAAACFASGGLDTLVEHLDGVGVHRGTGQFCFEFQDGCERR